MHTRPYIRRGTQRLLNLDASCTYYIVALANQISTQASNDYRHRFGIGVMEWRCLVFISIERTATASRIAALSKMDKALVSRALKKLKAMDLVRYAAADSDGRRRPLELTEQGVAMHAKVLESAIGNEQQLRAGLSDQDVREFLRVARQMQENVEKFVTAAKDGSG